MPNLFAYAMLFIWPLIMMGLFKNMTSDRALIWSFLGAHMFLPSGVSVDLPLIPVLDKNSIPSLAALVLCLIMTQQRIRIWPLSTIASILMIGFVLSPFPTTMSNRAPVIEGVVFLPGLSMRDAISAALDHAITIIPFILAFNFLTTHQARHSFLRAYLTAGLIYSVPILLEVRLAPQFSYWVYGYFPELFHQQVRFGGFRPVVFMGHGLWTAFFAMTAVLSTAILWRASNSKTRMLYASAMVYLLVVLVLCKTVGVLVFAALFLPIILFADSKIQSWAILVSALFVLIYPSLRSNDAIPTDQLLSYATLIQEERAQSLEFRFDNEKMLLEHALDQPLFGWGYWDRNRLFDPETGRDLTVTDGYWIIIMGVLGWNGYICAFGLLTLPLFRLWWQRNNLGTSNELHLIYGTSVLLAINLLEQIPNATINTMTWLLVGLLLASSLQAGKTENEGSVVEEKVGNGRILKRYSRPPGQHRPYSRTHIDKLRRRIK